MKSKIKLNRDTVRRIEKEIAQTVLLENYRVTFAQLEKCVVGFAELNPRAISYPLAFGAEEFFWDGMTKEGVVAIANALKRRWVALTVEDPIFYKMQARCPLGQKWRPVSLIPARAANFVTPNTLYYLPPDLLENYESRVAAEGLQDSHYRFGGGFDPRKGA